MSKTFRKTKKNRKIDWLPNIHEIDINGGSRYGYTFEPEKKATEFIKQNQHRKKDVGDYFMFNYSRSPSHWNHDFCTVPRRATERQLLNKIKKQELDPDNVVFRDGKKPVIYYW